MSRIKVIAHYIPGGVELHDTEGEVFATIKIHEIFSVGNSIGGYMAREKNIKGKQYVEFLSVSGGERTFSLEKLLKHKENVEGKILYPKEQVLWSLSSGSARNGLFHRIREEEDPLKKFLREELHISTSIIIIKDTIFDEDNIPSGGKGCHHVTSGTYHYFVTDGTSTCTHEGSEAVNQRNQYHEGCQMSPDYYTIKSASYLIQYAHHRESSPSIEKIVITNNVDKQKIIHILKDAGFGNK